MNYVKATYNHMESLRFREHNLAFTTSIITKKEDVSEIVL